MAQKPRRILTDEQKVKASRIVIKLSEMGLTSSALMRDWATLLCA